jgi:hypothetical protein
LTTYTATDRDHLPLAHAQVPFGAMLLEKAAAVVKVAQFIRAMEQRDGTGVTLPRPVPPPVES